MCIRDSSNGIQILEDETVQVTEDMAITGRKDRSCLLYTSMGVLDKFLNAMKLNDDDGFDDDDFLDDEIDDYEEERPKKRLFKKPVSYTHLPWYLLNPSRICPRQLRLLLYFVQ